MHRLPLYRWLVDENAQQKERIAALETRVVEQSKAIGYQQTAYDGRTARITALESAARAVVVQHLGTEDNELWCTWCDHAGGLGDENVHRPDCAMGALAALLEGG
jgi:hypothetical protein